MIGEIEARLDAADFYEVQTAIWALGTIGAVDSLPRVRTAAARYAPEHVVACTATAVELMLTNPDELYRRIEGHDHDLMPWLTRAAALLGTPRARAALAWCAANAPDELCRRQAAEDLA